MTVTAPPVIPRFAVPAPARPAPRGNLIDALGFTDLTRTLAGVDYVTAPCHPARLAPGLCFPNTDVEAQTSSKQLDQPQIVEGDAFAVYSWVGCNLAGEPWEPMATEAFTNGEGYAVDQAAFFLLLNNAIVIDSAAPSIASAVGQVELEMARRYAGAPTIVTTKLGVTVMGSQRVVFPAGGNRLETLNGSQVAPLSFANPAPVGGPPLQAGQVWVFGVGNPRLYRGAQFVSGPARDVSSNESSVLVERIWAITAECDVIAALAPVCPCSATA